MRANLSFVPISSIRKKVNLLLKCIPFFIAVTFLWYEFDNSPNKDLDDDTLLNGYDVLLDNSSMPYLTFAHIVGFINKTNRQQAILNADKFGQLTGDKPVIVVQVHNRIKYLTELINSLKDVKGIEDSLVIFSHDVFDPNINHLIERINFTKVLQIFYPYSLQMNKGRFPGHDPMDCPRDTSKQEARRIKCNNAEHPDSYGHYREAKYTQTKHHWWWKMNVVMEGLEATRNHSGSFILIEEDHYLAPDIFSVLKLMNLFVKTNCQICDIITLGVYTKSVNYAKLGDRIEVQRWISSRHNMGMVVDRHLWSKIKRCASSFCTYDDYNWDWSMQHVSMRCLNSPLIALSVVMPRVFHIGECGVHHKGSDCLSSKLVNKVKNVLRASNKNMFPVKLVLQKTTRRSFKMPKVNGGWADIRDHELCLRQLI